MKDNKRQSISIEETLPREAMVKPERSSVRADSLVTNLTTEKPMFNSHLMEAVCEGNNLKQALKRVKQNKGAPGIDEMTVEDLGEYLKRNYLDIRNSSTESPT